MSEIVNLRRFRKRLERVKDARRADENRRRYGQRACEREKTRSEQERQIRVVDGARLDDESRPEDEESPPGT
ncbi:DUF4169 family protein [Swaminathania salitolerans]|uniref:DUF4169 domain-containing protein n=1 Tax=Swaminathania salitolerans TaxID=182838 RepID=A0A511BPF2_9PROT|nr:DUF4169 family protein [Swaminathania salitolerans]GBQ15884.1 hypothetical protein AA21291_2335 [Swaminathania salitolerans LMG 21291]GEL01524.1 hypothetical protein SSA02_06870 [Swaminathania salitolerans]